MAFFDAEFLGQFVADIFLETGTHKGDGIRRALEAGMNEVHSIEISRRCLDELPDDLKRNPRVHLHCGDSAICLGDVLRSLAPHQSATLFLDAHVMTGRVTPARNPCPVLKELETIATFSDCYTILIDDMRIFETGRQSWEGITLAEIQRKVIGINPHYSIRFEKDLLIAIPPQKTSEIQRD